MTMGMFVLSQFRGFAHEGSPVQSWRSQCLCAEEAYEKVICPRTFLAARENRIHSSDPCTLRP